MGGRPRVLIVESNDAARVELADLLDLAGYDPIAAGAFEQGRQALRDRAPDLMIAAVRLGQFNGFQLLLTPPSHVPTILTGELADSAQAADAQRLGADYLIKPIFSATLLKFIDRKLAPFANR